jgi:hypothetical protein
LQVSLRQYLLPLTDDQNNQHAPSAGHPSYIYATSL